MAESQGSKEPREDDRKDRCRFPWWDLPDMIELVVLVGRGIAALFAMIAGAFRD